MTDEELIARLHGVLAADPDTKVIDIRADDARALLARIEALTAAHENICSLWAKEAAEKQVLAGRAEKAEAERDAAVGALRKAEQDFYEAANRFQDEDYEGPHEKFTVNVVCHIKPYFDMHMKHLRDSAAQARAAIARLKGADHD